MKEGLSRFRQPHQADYPRALSEIRNGRKTGHWIWYIFPQLKGLGYSSMSIITAFGTWRRRRPIWRIPYWEGI